MAGLFFLSGTTALSAEVILNRMLTYVFGSSHLATSTVLAAYMSGLTAGAYLVGRYTTRVRRPIFAYGLLEMIVGLFFALLPGIFMIFQEQVIAVTRPFADSPGVLTLLRFTFSFLLVLIPTVLMGGTLPMLVSAFKQTDAVQRQLPVLYSMNNLGAAAGTLVCSYVLILKFGLNGTLYLCALINVAVGLVSFAVSARSEQPEGTVPLAEAPAEMPDESPSFDALKLSPAAVCGLAFGQGFVVFVLEVVWFHLIGTVIGVTTYAFAVMLAVILLGIGMGSLLVPALNRLLRLPGAVMFAWAQIAMGLGVAASLYFWDRFPSVIAWTLELRADWSFAEREWVRFLFVLALLLPSTLAMGVGLPSLVAAVGRPRDGEERNRLGALVGKVFGANTLGTILGSLLCGFVLLGRVRSEHILSGGILATLLMALAARLLARGETRAEAPPAAAWPSKRAFILAGCACLALTFAFPGWNPLRLTAGSHYYWQINAEPGKLIYYNEDAQSGFITVEQQPDGLKVLKTNGKYEGSDAPSEFQDLFAFFGALYLKHFDRALLIGLGPGRTLSLMHAMPFRQIEAVEFSPAIIDAARTQFAHLAGAALNDSARVQVICNDGRNHLHLSPHKYAFIAVGITGAAFSGVGNLYNRDFFEIARSQLAEGGIFLMWIQIHHVFDHDVRSVMATLRQAFPHVHFYVNQDCMHGYLIASEAPLEIDPAAVVRFSEQPRLKQVLAQTGVGSLLELAAYNIFSSDAELDAYFKNDAIAAPPVVFSDFYPAFEYSTPYGLATRISGYAFQPFSQKRLPVFKPPLPPFNHESLLALRMLVAKDTTAALRHFEKAEAIIGKPVWQADIERLRGMLK